MEKGSYYLMLKEILHLIPHVPENISSPPTTGAWHSRLDLPLPTSLLKSRISCLWPALVAMHTLLRVLNAAEFNSIDPAEILGR